MSAQTYCPNCDIVYSMAHECCPLCMLKQVSGELCDKCGWAMRFPQEPCRCELEAENAKLRKLAYFGEHHFPDLTWKVRCEELLEENKELRKLLAEAVGECARCETLRDLADTAAAEQGLAQRRMMEAQRERDEARVDVNELRKLLRHFFGNGGGIPYTQWTREQHAAYDILQKG